MSSENIVITKSDLIEVIKKSRLETIAEENEPDNTDGALQRDTDDVVIEAEAEKFITLFKKAFTEETEEIDSEETVLHKIF